MAKNNNIGKDLADLLATHNFDVEMSSTNNQSATADEATVFKFDYVTPRGRNYGTAVIVISNDNELILFYGDNLGRGMEQEDKDDWFAFMKELKDFSIRHNFHNFSPKNLNQLKHTMQGMAAIKEGLFEGYYGNRRVSYMGEATDARLVIKHDRMIGENDKRYRYVESLFIETVDGERFRLPFKNLSGGRAMLEHVRQGGRPYDIRGQHITDTVNEMSVLSRFRRAQQGRVFEAATQRLVEQANAYYESLHTGLKRMATSRGYSAYFENWTPADIGPEESLVENLRSMFVQQTLDSRIEAALPTLAKLQGTTMKEADIFESWATRVTEGTWALPDNAEAQEKLNQLMNSELIVGPDAINATELLYDIVGDDRLYDILKDLADRNPRANIWDDSDVRNRMEELGIQLPMQSNGAEGEAGADTDNMGISADDQLSEGDNLATFEGSCNHTMEGEYCPEHGLMECGMHEDAHDPVHEARVANPRVNEIRTLAKWFFGGNPYSSATISGGRQLRLSFHIGHRLDGDYRYVPPSAISPADRRRLDRLKAKFMEYMAQKGVDQTEVSIQFHIGSGVYAGVRIAIPQEDGTIPTNLPTSTGPYKQYKGLAESAANMSESVYHPNKPYGVQYIVFAGKEQRAVTKEAWFATAEAMERGVERIENLPNFYEIRGYHYPEATTKSDVSEDASAMPTEKVGSIIRRVLGNRLTWTPGTSKLYKNTRKNKARTLRVDDYAMKYVDVQGVGGGGTSYDRAEEGGNLAKALKTELVRAGYPVSQGPIIFSDQIMFQTRSPITVTTEGDDRGNYRATAQAAEAATRAAKTPQEHARAADLHDRAATYALSDGRDESVIYDHQMTAREHRRAAKGVAEGWKDHPEQGNGNGYRVTWDEAGSKHTTGLLVTRNQAVKMYKDLGNKPGASNVKIVTGDSPRRDVAEGSLNEGYIVKNGSKYLKGHPAGGGQMSWVTDKAKATVFKSKGEITRAANMRGWSVIPAPQGVAEAGNNPVDHEWYRKQQERKAKAAKRQDRQQTQSKVAEGSKIARANKLGKAPKPKNQQEYDAIEKYRKDLAQSYKPNKEQGVAEGRATYGPITDAHKAAAKKAFAAGERDGKAGTEKNKEYMSSALLKTPYLNGYKQGKQGVSEGLGKSIKRGMAGWGAFDKDKPADVVNRVKGQDTDTLKTLSNRGSTGKGSPAELQQKAIGRELKKRGEQGVSEGQLNEYLTQEGQPLTAILELNLFMDMGPDGVDFMDTVLVKKYKPVASQLARLIRAQKKRKLTSDESDMIDKVWYDGSDAYDDMEVEFLADLYNQQIEVVKDILENQQGMAEGQLDEISAKLAQAVADKRGSNAAIYRAGLAATGVDQDAITKYPPWRKMSYKALKSQQAATQRLNKERGVEEATDQTVAESILRLQQLAQIRR